MSSFAFTCPYFCNNSIVHKFQETWRDGKASNWDYNLLAPHLWHLFDVMISTKEVLEDCFGYLSFRNSTGNRNPIQMSVERTYFLASLSPRWLDKAWPRVRLQPGDLANKSAINHARGREAFLPGTQTRKTQAFADLQKMVDAGQGMKSTSRHTDSLSLSLSLSLACSGSVRGANFDMKYLLRSSHVGRAFSSEFHVAGRKKIPGVATPALKVRPAGHLSDYRAVAAMHSLRLLAPTSFRDIGGCWCGELFQHGHLYRETDSGHTYMSLGFHFQTALLWQTQEAGDRLFALADLDLDLPECKRRLRPVCLSTLPTAGAEEDVKWVGVPAKPCPLDVWVLHCPACSVSEKADLRTCN